MNPTTSVLSVLIMKGFGNNNISNLLTPLMIARSFFFIYIIINLVVIKSSTYIPTYFS